mmetsp:Transcript_5018/g.12679  ORF Transcript_5018/g.12679 Transcript_5018/m.12679 type:complete len:201 (-) Transcript_5018:491-1093(-)
MHPKPAHKQLSKLLVLALLNHPVLHIVLCVLRHIKHSRCVVTLGQFKESASSFGGILARVHEDHDLVALFHAVEDLLVADLVHRGLDLVNIAPHHPHKARLERHRAVRRVKIEQVTCHVDAEEHGNVLIRGEGCRKPHDPDLLLGALDLPQCACNDGLDHGPALLVQQVDLIDNQQLHQASQRSIRTLPRDNIPLLRRNN